MSLKLKLLIGGIALAIIPLLIATMAVEIIATNEGRLAIEEQAQNRLIAVKDIKKSQIENYFLTIKNQVTTFANNRMIIDATKQFNDDFYNFNNQTPTATSKSSTQKLKTYYTKQFSAEYSNQNPGKNVDTNALINNLDKHALALQYQYIAANQHPLGNKHKLDAAHDNSSYSQTHRLYHPHIRDYLEKFGYYDIFIVNPKSGHIIYSVFKELDYATSLLNGPYANSGIAKAFNAANKITTKGHVALEDFSPYRPSYDGAASFIATPIFDGKKKIGILIFQMPVDEINRIMTHDQRWQEAGLGTSGEVYLVGPKGNMRSMSRFLIEDPKGYFSAIEKAGMNKSLIDAIRAKNTSIGLQPIRSDTAKLALSNQRGVKIINDYRNVPVVSAYSPVDILGLTWGILAEIDEEEAFAAEYTLSDSILISSLIITFITLIIASASAWLFATLTTKPIIKLSNFITEVERDADLTKRIEVGTKDEIGMMAQSLDNMLDKFQSSIQQVASAADQIASSSEEMTQVTMASNESIQKQMGETHQVATSVTEMSCTSQEVADNTVHAATAAEEATQATANGQNVVRNTLNSINALANEVECSADTLNTLRQDSTSIGTVLDVIREIAEQTNLLALNAAIEAARAGDHGRGFAVVADEVRTLASRTQESTEEIQRTIERLQSAAETAVQTMESGRKQAHNSVNQASEAGQALESIATSVSTILDMNTQIASAAEEQTAVSNEISKNITQINEMAKQTASGAEQTATSSTQLAELATGLQSMIKQFKA